MAAAGGIGIDHANQDIATGARPVYGQRIARRAEVVVGCQCLPLEIEDRHQRIDGGSDRRGGDPGHQILAGASVDPKHIDVLERAKPAVDRDGSRHCRCVRQLVVGLPFGELGFVANPQRGKRRRAQRSPYAESLPSEWRLGRRRDRERETSLLCPVLDDGAGLARLAHADIGAHVLVAGDLRRQARVAEDHRVGAHQVRAVNGEGRRRAALNAVRRQAGQRRRPGLRHRLGGHETTDRHHATPGRAANSRAHRRATFSCASGSRTDRPDIAS